MEYCKFQQPDSIFRPAPFWAINDRITPEETARQLADMLEVGLGGAFFHSRAGLITDYLGEDWFAAMEAALQAARRHDGFVWLYDEDLWPSGNAGGQVAGMKDEYRSATLHAQLLMPGETLSVRSDGQPRAAYRIIRDGITLKRADAITLAEAAALTETERLVFTRCYAPKTGWWSGESYANLLHPQVAELFINLTHEVYRHHFEDEFGYRVPGIFTDEPQLGHGPFDLPWYEGLPERYAEWTGRDFWDDLPLLYFDAPESRKARLLIHRSLLRQFCAAYSKPIYDWCEQYGIAHTGHYNAEETFRDQILNHGGGVMAHYRYQQIPGIDHLCRQTTPLLLCLKQVGSAARQLGRDRVLTELFGVTRHTNTFQDFKWIGDYDLVLGANLFCPHLTLYSARGRRKRDYPPNWNYQQTYWPHLRPLNDYFARVSYALTCGHAQAEVLLLHSIESGTAGHRLAVDSTHAMPGEDLHAADHAEAMLRRALEAILNAGYECDLGDEGYLEEMGAVEGDALRVGKMRYRVVVVPPAQTWRPSTYSLLQQFVLAGGKVIFLGELPTELDCEPAYNAWRELAGRAQVVPCARGPIQEAVHKVASRGYRLHDRDGRAAALTYLQHRVDGEQEIFFIVNADRERGQSYTFTLLDATDRTLTIWNALDGSRTDANTQHWEGDLYYHFTLPPAGSLLLVAGPQQEKTPEAILERTTAMPDLSAGEVKLLPDTWQYKRSEENVLVLDRLCASVDGGKSWWNTDLDFRVRGRLAAHFGITDALQWQPWVAIRKKLFDGKGGEVRLRYAFRSAIAAPRASLVIEDMTKGEVTVNGTPVDLSNAGWHWDRGFGKVEIGELITPGLNVVEYKVNYDFLTEIEPAYVVGDFGVRLANPYEGEIIAESEFLATGSWLGMGYPFYSGTMTYRCHFHTETSDDSRSFLRLNRASGVVFMVRLNGEEVGPILWQPHVIELTEMLKDGTNILEIDVISSRQNTLGPLHEKDGDDHRWCGPNAFEEEVCIREEFSLFDYGLLGGAEIVTIPW